MGTTFIFNQNTYFCFDEVRHSNTLTVNNTLNANNKKRIHFIPPSTILIVIRFHSTKFLIPVEYFPKQYTTGTCSVGIYSTHQYHGQLTIFSGLVIQISIELIVYPLYNNLLLRNQIMIMKFLFVRTILMSYHDENTQRHVILYNCHVNVTRAPHGVISIDNS